MFPQFRTLWNSVLLVTTHLVPERAARRFDRFLSSPIRTAKLRASGPARGVQDTATSVQSESER